MATTICAFCQHTTESDDVDALVRATMQHMMTCEKHPMSKLVDLLVEVGNQYGAAAQACREAHEVLSVLRKDEALTDPLLGRLRAIAVEAGPMATADEIRAVLAAHDRPT